MGCTTGEWTRAAAPKTAWACEIVEFRLAQPAELEGE
jgi:hypothetical protein